MNKALPFFNWSLQKALDSEHDSIIKARIRIIYTVLLFSLLKASIVIVIGSANGQSLQVIRAAIAFGIYIALAKVLLYKPSRLELLAHIMIVMGILIIWSNIFVYAHKINLITVQFIFMLMLSSFYILGRVLGITYSTVGRLRLIRRIAVIHIVIWVIHVLLFLEFLL